MKINRIIFSLILLIILASSESCVVLARHDNGNHKGWYKNENGHKQSFSANPGHSKIKFHK